MVQQLHYVRREGSEYNKWELHKGVRFCVPDRARTGRGRRAFCHCSVCILCRPDMHVHGCAVEDDQLIIIEIR
jgi:hypothetical protein